jgi:Domain of Unknown Function (DUF1080)
MQAMTQRRTLLAASAAFLGTSLSGCASMGMGGWTTLVDGATMKNLDGWAQLGEGNWSITEGTLQGKAGRAGFLVTPSSYSDFEIQAEFWADETANSGIFIRCQDPKKVEATNSYEVNIFDRRPDPSYGTGAIVDFAKVAMPYPQAANKWNTFLITAKGDQLVIKDSKYRSGPIALQSAAGTIRFRSVRIRAI